MSVSRSLLAVLVASLLGGCVSIQPAVLGTATPSATTGYVAGIFSRGAGAWGYAFELVENGTGKTYTMAFDEAGPKAPDRQTTSMIEVPAGEYRIAAWKTYGWLLKMEGRRNEVPRASALGRPFAVKPGQVVVIGQVLFSTEVRYSILSTKFTWAIYPQPVPEAEAVATFRRSFPGFEQAPVGCVVCVRDGATGGPAPAR